MHHKVTRDTSAPRSSGAGVAVLLNDRPAAATANGHNGPPPAQGIELAKVLHSEAVANTETPCALS